MSTTSANTSFGKSAAYNPALFADDVMDFYMQYTAAKRNMNSGKKTSGKPQVQGVPPVAQAPKVASIFDSAVKAVEPVVEKVIENPMALAPFAGALAAGTAVSMYAPESLYGPTREQIDAGKRFNMRRALAASGGIMVADAALSSIPYGVKALANPKGTTHVIGGVSALLPVTAGAGVALKRKLQNKPFGIRPIVKGMQKGLTANIVVSSVALGYELGNLAAEAANAAEAAKGGI